MRPPEHDPEEEAEPLERWTRLRLGAATWLANLLTFAALAGPLLFGVDVQLPHLVLLLLLLPAMLLVHELIHAVAFVAVGAHPSSIRIGYDDRRHMAWCSCDAQLSRADLLVVLLAPLVVGGLIPYGVSISSGTGWLFWFSGLMIGSAAGDLIDVVAPMRDRRRSQELPASVEEARKRIQPRPSALREAIDAAVSSRDAA